MSEVQMRGRTLAWGRGHVRLLRCLRNAWLRMRGGAMRDLGNGYRQSDNLCVRCYGNDPEYETDSDLYEICPDCGEVWHQAPEFTIEAITEFYQNALNVGSSILRSILNERDAYIAAKKLNPRWSEITLEMATFNNQALRMLSICKHTFGAGVSLNNLDRDLIQMRKKEME